jgi:hypothetical protein
MPSAPPNPPPPRSLRSASRALATPGEGEGEARGGRVAGREVPRARLRQREYGLWEGLLLPKASPKL